MGKNILVPVASLLLTAGMLLQACKKDDFSYQVATRQVLMLDMIKEDTSLTLAVAALEKAGIAPSLNAYGPLTFFAPDNNAFRKFFANQKKKGLDDFTVEEINTVISYHILPTRLKSVEFIQGPQTTPTGKGDYITLDISQGYKSNAIANGKAKIYQTDQEFSNGYVHKMDGVLDPPTLTIGQFLQQNQDQYSIIYKALQRAQLLDTLTNLTNAQNQRIRLTLFAETDAVLKAAGIQNYDNLDDAALKRLMYNHLVAGGNFSSSYTHLTTAIANLKIVERWDSTVTTLSGQEWIYFNLAGKHLINDKIDFTASDVIMRNGILHNVSEPLVWDSTVKRTQIYHLFWQNPAYAWRSGSMMNASTGGAPSVLSSSGDWRYYYEGTPAQNFLFFNPGAIGDSMVSVVKNVKKGKYRLTVNYKSAFNRGTWQLKYQEYGEPAEANIGAPVNYAPDPQFYQNKDIGTYTFKTSGDKRLKFVCTVVGGLNLHCLILTPVYD